MTPVAPFFEAYARAFEAYDADAITGAFTVPCLFVRDRTTEVRDTEAGVRESVEALLKLHRAWDVQKAEPRDVHVLEAAAGHAVVRVDWRLGRKRTRIRWTFATTYTLVPNGDGWRIASAITHDAPF
ncbi:MAG: nuclear transport factor 2 family protein [Bacteroidota bacterium]